MKKIILYIKCNMFLMLIISINCALTSLFSIEKAHCSEFNPINTRDNTFVNYDLILEIKGLVAYYPLDNSGDDISLNANNGRIFNTISRPGRFGNDDFSLEFLNDTNDPYDPSVSYISVPDDTSLEPETEITVSAAIYANKKQPGAIVVKAYKTGDNASYALANYTDGYLYFSVNNGTGLFDSVRMLTPEIKTWHHIAATWDGIYLKLYLNGEQVDETQFSGKIVYDNSPFFIASHESNGDHIPEWGWNGMIDDVIIFNRSLDEDEIKFLNNPLNQENQLFKISIIAPENGLAFDYGEVISFNSIATETQAPYTFTWTSNIDGFLGEGKSITLQNLSLGLHFISLKGEDGFKKTDISEIQIVVLNREFITKAYEIIAGNPDGFNENNIELSTPDLELIDYMTSGGYSYTNIFDRNNANNYFVHTFNSLNKGEVICNADILLHIKPVSNACNDDTIKLGFFRGNLQEDTLIINIKEDINYDCNQTTGSDLIINLSQFDDLHSKLLMNMQKYGFLDIIIGQDTCVDFIKMHMNIVTYSGSVAGYVNTSVVGYETPVKNALIQISETGQNVITDRDGRFELLNLKKGKYSILIQSDFFKDKFIENIIISGGQINLPPISLSTCKYSNNQIEKDIYGIKSKFDMSLDNKIGLEEAIHALKITSEIQK